MKVHELGQIPFQFNDLLSIVFYYVLFSSSIILPVYHVYTGEGKSLHHKILICVCKIVISSGLEAFSC